MNINQTQANNEENLPPSHPQVPIVTYSSVQLCDSSAGQEDLNFRVSQASPYVKQNLENEESTFILIGCFTRVFYINLLNWNNLR